MRLVKVEQKRRLKQLKPFYVDFVVTAFVRFFYYPATRFQFLMNYS